MSSADTSFGARLQPGGGVAFRLWAPSATDVSVEIGTDGAFTNHPLTAQGDGWHVGSVPSATAGVRYQYAVGGLHVPDPASRYNPDGTHGTSEVVDPGRYAWRDMAWKGRPWHEAVIYELHVGTFTPEGTFAAARQRLAELADLGITAIELMPVAEFGGSRNWGYDGVLLFAPDASYGHPDDLKAFVDEAHALGLMVLLDVVYNHFGPEGNFLHAWCPEFFNPQHQTPWGSSINFDGEHHGPVRQFYRENVLYWTEEFHFDGLRLDAVHQIRDDSTPHILDELAAALHDGPGRKRHVHLVLENDANDAALLERGPEGGPRSATAQWNDDFHHSAHVALSGETEGYYADYARDNGLRLGRSLAHGFDYQGQESVFRGEPRGSPSAHLPPQAFIAFLQNHDQVGNRAFGDRIDKLASTEVLATMYACLLLAPHIPMLFMGEEFAASSPFLYFCDFHGDLGRAVTTGRSAEFAGFAAFADESSRRAIPDPVDLATFERSKLPWQERELPRQRERLDLIRTLLALRHQWLVPRMAGPMRGGTYQCHDDLLQIEWALADGLPWNLLVNLGDRPVVAGKAPAGTTVYQRHATWQPDGTLDLGPHGVAVVTGAHGTPRSA